MKQKTILFVVLMLQLGLTIAFAKTQKEDPKEKEEIELKHAKQTPFSIFPVELDACHDGLTIELFVENYTGSVTMRIAGSSQSVTVAINGSGQATMDISQLPEGSYTLQVTVGSRNYEGDFEL